MKENFVNCVVQYESIHNFEEQFLEDFSQNFCGLGYFALARFYFFRMYACFVYWQKKHYKFKYFKKCYC